jgi:glycosyltransferase involved in cell wall biosynthesis|tara:strand:- start:779 stop:1726 length:948 start_codon:yes stop_codon:yes gene_type:complete
MDNKKKISVISPCFNEELNVKECYKAVNAVFKEYLSDYDYEHIFTDNSSNDNTVNILRKIAADDKRVKVIVNSRNFGPLKSAFNGVLRSSGDAVLVMLAVDLQDPPELIPEFVKKWEEGFKIVAGSRREREEGIIMRNTRKLFYHLVLKLSYVSIPPYVGEFQLIDKVIVDKLREFDDYDPYIRGMIANCGYETIIIPYKWKSRKKGKSKLKLYQLFDIAFNGMISFSNVPMRGAIVLGTLISITSLTYAIIMLIINIIFYRIIAPPGIATLITALFFFSGVNLLFLGLLGEYICAIHSQVRKKPLVIEKETINF